MCIKTATWVATLFLVSSLYGADVRVTDSKGNVVDVRGVAIDYTEYSLAPPDALRPSGANTGGAQYTYTPDHERLGVRAFQGDGLVTIKWSQIQAIAIKGKNKSVVPWRFDADITLKSGKVLTTGLYIASKQGLHGETDLGDYSVQLESVKAITVLPAPSGKP